MQPQHRHRVFHFEFLHHRRLDLLLEAQPHACRFLAARLLILWPLLLLGFACFALFLVRFCHLQLPNSLFHFSSVVPHFLQTRTFRSPRISCPTRTGPQVPHTSITFEIALRLSCSAIPPLTLRCAFGRTCSFDNMTCSTSTFASLGNTRSTRPSLPLSRPVTTRTVSLRRISTLLCAVVAVIILLTRVALSHFRFLVSNQFLVS